jgi:hypothetical protein
MSAYALTSHCTTCPAADALSNWSQGFGLEGMAFGVLLVAAALSPSCRLQAVCDAFTVLAGCLGVLLLAVMAAVGPCWTCLAVWASVWLLAADVLRRNASGRARERAAMVVAAACMFAAVGWVAVDASASAAMKRAVVLLNPPLGTPPPQPAGPRIGSLAPPFPGLPASGTLLFWRSPCENCWSSTVSKALKRSGATLVTLKLDAFTRRLAGGGPVIVAGHDVFQFYRIPPGTPIIVRLVNGRLTGWLAADRYGGQE